MNIGDFFETSFGRFIRGIMKLALAGFLIMVVGSFNNFAVDIDLGNGAVIPVGTILKLIIGFFPLMLLISSMRDLGIWI